VFGSSFEDISSELTLHSMHYCCLDFPQGTNRHPVAILLPGIRHIIAKNEGKLKYSRLGTLPQKLAEGVGLVINQFLLLSGEMSLTAVVAFR